MWAGYTRVSRVGDRAATLISPDLQADRIRQFAHGRGIEVDVLAPELDQSGGKVDRPILQEVIEGIEAGRYAGIIVAQLDRLSRMDITDALHTIRRIESCGGEVIAVAENFDAGTPEGRMARNVILAMGEMQLERYRAQFAAAKASAVSRGIWPVPEPPLGYRRGKDRKLIPDQAQRVQRAYEARAAGASWAVVADILRTSDTNAGKVIRNRAYLGEINLGTLRNRTAHQPIVSRSLWEAAQIAHPRRARSKKGPSLLAGLIRCAGCQRNMSPEVGKDNRYRCFPRNVVGRCGAPAGIAMSLVEPYVESVTLAHLRIAFRGSESTDALDAASRRLDAAEAELAAYQRAVEVADLGADLFLVGMTDRVRAVEQARRDLGNVRVSRAPVVGDLHALWPEMTVEEKRHVLRGALGVVWVWKGRGEGRVKLVEAGHEPVFGFGPVEWRDLPGEIRPATTEDVE